jgi:hypothetical protein
VLERRTFIVRFRASARTPELEDVSTGERVQLPDVASLPGEIRGRLAADEATAHEHLVPPSRETAAEEAPR